MTGALIEVTGATDAAGARVELTARVAHAARVSVLRLLAESVLCDVASVTPEGRAHVHTAYFCVAPDLALYFLSHPGSLHGRNLAENRSAAIAVHAPGRRWGGPDRGLQLFGACALATGARARAAERCYARRFAAYARWRAALAAPDVGRAYRFYRFVPSTLKVLDEAALGDGVLVHARVMRRGRRGVSA